MSPHIELVVQPVKVIKSPVRYVGGKNWLVDRLVREIHSTSPQRYIEPFVGGGAIALNIRDTIPKYLGDTNAVVMDLWRCLRSAPEALLEELGRVEKRYGDTNEGYLNARQELNSMILSTRPMWIRRAAIFLYLNARSFNGIWRVNERGLYNVPYGKIKKPSSIDLEEAKVIQQSLLRAQLITGDYAKVLDFVNGMQHTAIYADPPYDGTFEGYSANGFDEADQRALAAHLKACVTRGARVWATNADTPLIREIYSWAEIISLQEQHSVGATAARRGKRNCVLIRGSL